MKLDEVNVVVAAQLAQLAQHGPCPLPAPKPQPGGNVSDPHKFSCGSTSRIPKMSIRILFYSDPDPDSKGVKIKEDYTNKFSTKFF